MNRPMQGAIYILKQHAKGEAVDPLALDWALTFIVQNWSRYARH